MYTMVTSLRYSLATFLVLLCFASSVMAQSRTVTGTVTSEEDGTPLAGASVTLVGTTVGTAADMNGQYELTVPQDGGTLRFSFIGFVAQDVPIGDRSVVNVALRPDFRQLDEVVVVGYGSQIQRALTGNISRVSAREIEDESVLSVEEAIQGRMAGVQIQSNNGKLGQGIQVRVRGSASVTASNQPLYVIDGIPVTTQNLSSNDAPTNPIADINPNDIESIEVLKDASAAAIYGARGSNGVVLITTKGGTAGVTRFDVNYQRGWSNPTNKVELLNGPEYVELMQEAAANTARLLDDDWYIGYLESVFDFYALGADWRGGEADFNWQDQAFQDAGSHSLEMNAQGGDARTRFFISGTVNDATGILVADEFTRMTGRVNVEHDLSDRFQLGGRLNIARSLNKRLSTDNEFATPMQLIAQMPINPIFAPQPGTDEYVPSEDLNHNTVYYNSLLHVDNVRYNTTVYRTLGNVYGTYEFVPGLTFRTEFGVDVLDQNEDLHYNSQVARGLTDAENGLAIDTWDRVVNYTTNNFLNYIGGLGEEHGYDVTIGTSYQQADWNWSSVTGTQFPSDEFTQVSSAANITGGTGGATAYSFLSYFGRVNYQFLDRYLLTLSGRYDGSSRFGADHRFGFFPAASLGWIISDERFMQDSPFSFLKLRASYGLTGNAEIGNFGSRGLWSASGYAGISGMFPTQTENPDLRWERTEQANLGLDFGLFNDRINVQADYYLKNTTDLLLNVQVPSTTGFTSETRNVGTLRNHGLEFVINTRNLTGEFGWTSSFVFGTNANRITDLDGQVINGGFINRAVEDHPIGVFYSLEYAGVDPDNGDALYFVNATDENGDIIDPEATTNNPNAANPVVIGDPNPDFTGGLT
ncbi:MAG: SusC/RagA family TonB-linked outer membrane protein, partial [Rhodothermales bacterium]